MTEKYFLVFVVSCLICSLYFNNNKTVFSLNNSCNCKYKILRPLKKREDLGAYLESEGFKTGAEVGVQRGVYSEILLKNWPSCTNFTLVDVWKQLKNYQDGANVDDSEQNALYNLTMERLKPYKDKLKVHRMYSTEAAKLIPDNSLDFAFIDARHDYCGANEDLVNYWPKVRVGGIIAGHDYVSHLEIPFQDWSLCQDGRREPGSVERAVFEFGKRKGSQPVIGYRESGYNFWMMRRI